MNSKELKEKLSLDMIVDLVIYLGGEFNEQMETNEKMVLNTSLCHGGESWKCELYKDSFNFHCYTNCGTFDIITLVQEVMNLSFTEAIEFIEEYFHLGINFQRGFGRPKKKEVPIRKPIKKEVDFNEQLPEYDGSILNTFINYKPIEWIYEGISVETMEKYGIRYSIENNSIIIPHRDKDGRLVGIRERNLDKRQVEVLGRKYVPHTSFAHRLTYKHRLSMNAYGIDKNKEAINEYKKCIIFEAEKSVLKMDTAYGNNPSVAVGGSSISEYQLNLLKTNGCEKVYLAFDREDGEKWENKLDKICQRIVNFGLECYIIEDKEGKYLDLKDSPIDNGQEVFEILLQGARKYEK